MLQTEKPPQTDWLIKAVQRMFKPVARLLVGRMACPVAVDLLKEAYIEEATRQLIKQEGRKRATKSALALRTGLDTRVIAGLEALPRSQRITPADLCPEAAVLHAWSTEKAFVEKGTGEPRVLNVYGRKGTFQNLIMRYAGRNVTCPTVLASLTAGGNVELIGEDQVRMLSPHYISTTPFEQSAIEAGSLAFDRMGQNVTHNFRVDSPDSAWPQEARLARRLSDANSEALRRKIDALLSTQADAVEAELKAAPVADGQDDGKTAGVGWFYWEESGSKD
ncbi:MAG: hypothetical protein EA370_10860 [Wenzhouxiangella sp.]|nr:MAG: hypothetical protein EA370_10860 [Wenzhouxiangella sp.]